MERPTDTLRALTNRFRIQLNKLAERSLTSGVFTRIDVVVSDVKSERGSRMLVIALVVIGIKARL
jgi:hypothetical protein